MPDTSDIFEGLGIKSPTGMEVGIVKEEKEEEMKQWGFAVTC